MSPRTKGGPKEGKEYVQVRLHRDVYEKLADLRFEFKVLTFNDVVKKLIEEYEKSRED